MPISIGILKAIVYQRLIHLPLNHWRTAAVTATIITFYLQTSCRTLLINTRGMSLCHALTYACQHVYSYHSEPHRQQIHGSYKHAASACSIHHPLHQKSQSKVSEPSTTSCPSRWVHTSSQWRAEAPAYLWENLSQIIAVPLPASHMSFSGDLQIPLKNKNS